MRMTLLKMTQNILSAMDSDAVNSIADTVESLQVAEEIIATYNELYSGVDRPSMWNLMHLQPINDVDNPTIMRIPDDVKYIKWIRYNGKDVDFMEPEDFIVRMEDYGDLYFGEYKVNTGADPKFWTTFDNNHVVFDGFNNDEDGILQASKAQIWGQRVPVFKFEDNAYPPFLSPDEYAGLLAEAKSACFINLKGVTSQKEEQRSRRQRMRRQNDEWRLNQRKPFDRGPNYGRPTRGSSWRSGRATT